MKRKPAIHVTREHLEKILGDIDYRKMTAKNLAGEVFRLSVPFNIKSRVPVDLDSKQKKKVAKIVVNDTEIVEKFNGILHSVRLEAKHKHIKAIRKGDVEYPTLMEVAKLAYEFAEVFDYKPRTDGYKTFCEIGLEMMGKKYGLSRFRYFAEKIYERVGYAQEIEKFEDKPALMELANYYLLLIKEYGGIPDYSINQDFTKLVHILWAYKVAEEMKADPKVFMKAQFESFAPLNFIPELIQLSTPKAKERYLQYKGQAVKEPEKYGNMDEDEKSLYQLAIEKALQKKKYEISNRKH